MDTKTPHLTEAWNTLRNLGESALGEYQKGAEQALQLAATRTAEGFKAAAALQSGAVSAVRASFEAVAGVAGAVQSAVDGLWKGGRSA